MKAHFLPSSVCWILLCSIALPIAAAIVLPSFGPGTLPPVPQKLTHVGNPRCAFTSEWSSGHVVPKRDCFRAIDRLEIISERYGLEKFEFFNGKGQRKTGFHHVDTPVCYDAGACAVCLAMLTDFSEEILHSIPRPPPEPWPTNDVADTVELWNAAKRIGNACVRDADGYGWESVGASQSLGVFIWAGGSALEKDVSRPAGIRNMVPLLPGYRPGNPLPGGMTS